jgi:hypothetical protein
MADMKDFFEGDAEVGRGSEEMLMKALSAGFGTDAAQFTGGRALQPEDCEVTLVNVMREQREDFKLMNSLKKTTVKSTVRQYNIRTDVGEEDVGFVGEGEVAPDNAQDIRRMTREMAFIQKRGAVTEQALVVDTFEDAYEAEKFATTLSVLKTAEKYCFHGDSKVVPKQYDGLIAQINEVPDNKRKNIIDLRGQTIAAVGEGIFTEMTERIYDQGGEANKVFYPLALGADIQDMVRDRLRFGTTDKLGAIVIREYPTLYGSLAIAGSEAGPNKMFMPKRVVKPLGNTPPNKPASVALSLNAAGVGTSSKFFTPDAGIYTYEVFAVDEYGISEGTSATAPIVVAKGDSVIIRIVPAATKPGTGFIICRSAKDGVTPMEMVRIGIDKTRDTTEHVDLNEDLPGTAEMLFLTEKRAQQVAEFYQLLPMRLFRMFPWNTLVSPFIMALWGTPILKAPHWCGVVKNIAYKGGLYG